MRTLRVVCAVAFFLLATSGPASAAAPWSPPSNVASHPDGATVVALDFSAQGRGLLGLRRGLSGTSSIARVNGDGTVGTPSALSRELIAGPGLDATGRALLITRQVLPGERERLRWARVTPGGNVGRLRSLAVADCLSCQVTLAVNPRGDAIAAWPEAGRTRAAYRRAGGSFGRPVTVFRSGSGNRLNAARAAIGADGRAIVVETSTARVRARVRTRRGAFGAAMRAGPHRAFTQTSAAVSDRGEAVVVWGTQDGGEEANAPWVVRAARLARGGRHFSATQTLDAGAGINRPEGAISLDFASDGTATVAWSSVASDNGFPVMTATAGRGQPFGAAQRVASSGGVGDLAVRGDGAAVVTWARVTGPQAPDMVLAAVRPAGAAAFGAPEAVGGPESPGDPLVAFDAVSGDATAAWSARPLAGPGDVFLRVAHRVVP